MSALAAKKYLDANGLAYFSRKLDQYPTNDILGTVIDAIQESLDEKVNSELLGQANGVAELGLDGTVPTSQLPLSVHDVLVYTTYSNFPLQGETGKLYIDSSTSRIYCWNGTQYSIVGGEIITSITNAEIDALFD